MWNVKERLRAGFEDLEYCARHEKTPNVGRWLAGKMLSVFYFRAEYYVLTRSLEEPLPSLEARLPITYRLAEPDDLSLLSDAVFPSELAYFRNRLAHGRVCLLAVHEDNVAAYSWMTDEVTFDIDNLELKLGPGDAYVDDIFTVPAYRRQGIGGALHLRRLQYLKEHGFKRAVLIVLVDNVPALKIDKKLGYHESDRLTFRRILLKRDYRYHNARF